MQPRHAILCCGMMALITATALPQSAAGSCGLDQCPVELPDDTSQTGIGIHLFTRYTAAPDGAAWYGETFLGAHIRSWRTLQVGASLPVLLTSDAFGKSVGLGNGIAYIDWGLPLTSSVWAPAVGLQVELPTTTHDAHADAHVVLLPYLRSQLTSGRFDVVLRAAWGRTVGLQHTHGPVAQSFNPRVTINPHSASEGLLRCELGWTQNTQQTWFRPALRLDVIQEFVDNKATPVSTVALVDLGRGYAHLRAQLELPITATRRFDWRGGLQVTFDQPISKEP